MGKDGSPDWEQAKYTTWVFQRRDKVAGGCSKHIPNCKRAAVNFMD
jgi:hypothetical protein